MAREYRDVQKTVVTQRECVKLTCDMCGRKAEYPDSHPGAWEWGSVGMGSGELSWQRSIDGDYDTETVDLCYECAEKIADLISRKSFALRQLLGIT